MALSKIDGVYSIDFRNSSENALGGESALKNLGNGFFGLIAGNAQADSLIDTSDKALYWDSQSGKKGYSPPDFNLDEEVNNTDKNDFCIPNLGRSVQIPE